VLQLERKYKATYQKELKVETYGFKTLNELLMTIDHIDLFYDEKLALWFLKYNPKAVAQKPQLPTPPAPMEVAQDDEVIEVVCEFA